MYTVRVSYHVLHLCALSDAPLEHPHQCDRVGQSQTHRAGIQL